MEEKWVELCKKGEILPENDVYRLCAKSKEILIEENNCVAVFSPVVICGNIHGQFYDLLELFRTGGSIPQNNYVFLGNFVNRGNYSIETIQLLLALKVRYPGSITLLRGNHESRSLCQTYGFYDECMHKYGNSELWKQYMDVFDQFPIVALVNNTILWVHGGISWQLRTLDQLRQIDRFREIAYEGPFSDLVWNDPTDDADYFSITPAGQGQLFGKNATAEFCHVNNLQLIARSHQLCMQGYQYWFPQEDLLTVYSAPNYCGRCENLAAILCIDDYNNREIKTFEEAEESKRIKRLPFRDLYPMIL